MENLENGKKYKRLEINGLVFLNVEASIWMGQVQLFDSWGRVSATIKLSDIDTLIFN